MAVASSAPDHLVPAPGARGAKLCGIWSIIASCTCVGLPIGIVLAIIALVLSAKARRLAKENPETYERPTATGLVTGIIGLAMPIVMLPFIGIASAIAIPALLNQRARAEGKAMVQTVHLQLAVMQDYMHLRETSDPALSQTPDKVVDALIEYERAKVPQPENAYDGGFPFEKAPHPSKAGNVSLWVEQDAELGPVIQIRYTTRLHGKDQESSIPLSLR